MSTVFQLMMAYGQQVAGFLVDEKLSFLKICHLKQLPQINIL